MSVRVEVVCVNAGGDEQRQTVLTFEERQMAVETLGMNLSEGKALLAGIQAFIVAQQVHQDLKQHRLCPECDQRHTRKDASITPVRTSPDLEQLTARAQAQHAKVEENRLLVARALFPKRQQSSRKDFSMDVVRLIKSPAGSVDRSIQAVA